jgi:hypothetical protein
MTGDFDLLTQARFSIEWKCELLNDNLGAVRDQLRKNGK